jgi:hypothetical protein
VAATDHTLAASALMDWIEEVDHDGICKRMDAWLDGWKNVDMNSGKPAVDYEIKPWRISCARNLDLQEEPGP